ncbi:MAG: molybdenum cofactor biosynthesis protein MoaE [Halothiobacillus sp. 20-53-49]|nr:molybdenum cofactor biosynthesis protein MoaE [Halothiobacillaceae bacterium]OYV45426.1 MAG: molybdenum cofactor biosynthesis protein MoaE [Halothiobacillus sp. 20-53-49]HUM99386.1 molybdenum cofactor biosynthesis protein MoaE [Halothiobacillus sp.]
MKISVQAADFDVTRVLAELRDRCAHVGAVACFLGTVRDMNESRDVAVLTLEHYPGMTERALARVALEAQTRFPVAGVTIIHRVGALYPTDQIVLVAVASAHRHDALQACTFMMDYLKTHAPFWKKETDPEGQACWVDARESDAAAHARWFADFDSPPALSGSAL